MTPAPRDQQTSSPRLAVYGTLAPGRPNHHVLGGVDGQWTTGTVRGRLTPTGWGTALGYPALVLDPTGDPVPVHVLTSPDLAAHWARLDEFEGAEYERVDVQVETGGTTCPAQIYVGRG